MYPEFKPPDWCGIKYNGVADAIIGAAKLVGAKLCTSSSFTFDLEEWDIVSRYLQRFGKPVLTKHIVRLCKDAVGETGGGE